MYFPRYCHRRGGRCDLKLECSSGTDFFFFSFTQTSQNWVKEKKRKRNKPFRCKIQLNNVYLLVTQNSIPGKAKREKGKKQMKKLVVFSFIIFSLVPSIHCSDEALQIISGCFRDFECNKGEYCDKESKGCVKIPECKQYEARENGNEFGQCVSCVKDEECRWGVQEKRKHNFCWIGDGLCREKPPFTLNTYAWQRKYDSKTGFVDEMVPTTSFVDGEPICFVVSTYLNDFTKYLDIQIDEVTTCALRQTEFEALIRIEEMKRLQDHHGIEKTHLHHGIIPYQPEHHNQTGCNTNRHGQLNVVKFIGKNAEQPGDFHDNIGNASFTITDSKSGSSALCVKAQSISPNQIPLYIQAEISINPQYDIIEKELHSSKTNDEYDEIEGLLEAYGIDMHHSKGKKRFSMGNRNLKSGRNFGRHTAIVVSNLDHGTYIVCGEGSHYDGHHSCTHSSLHTETYFWTLILSSGAIILGLAVFFASFGSVVVV